jgi:hypothetical protein
MTMHDAAKTVSESVNGVLGKIAIGVLTSLSVLLFGWGINVMYDDGRQLAGVSADIRGLTIAIGELSKKEDGAIQGLITVQSEQGKELSALRQKLTDHERAIAETDLRQDGEIERLSQPRSGPGARFRGN